MAPGIVGVDQLLARLANPVPTSALIEKIPETALEGLLNARRVRRLSDYVKLQLAAATLAVRHAGIAETDLAAFSAILSNSPGINRLSLARLALFAAGERCAKRVTRAWRMETRPQTHSSQVPTG